MVDHLNRLGLRGKWSKELEVDAARAAEAAVRSERALGQVILTAGYNGEIKVFENLGAPSGCNNQQDMLGMDQCCHLWYLLLTVGTEERRGGSIGAAYWKLDVLSSSQ